MSCHLPSASDMGQCSERQCDVLEQLREAIDRVVPDLVATSGLTPEIRDVEWAADPPLQSAMLHSPNGSGRGISIRSGETPVEQVADLADQIQEWAVEELCAIGQSATWPECPEHPASHPLSPRVLDGVAVWQCPRSHQTIAEIGHLRR
jgi:hypothetical protein